MWNAVWSLSVCALTSAPSRSASRLICWQSRPCVPLKAMCSTKWLMPFRRRLSWLLPVRTKTLTLAVCRCGRRIVTTRTPLARVVTVVSPSCSRSLVMRGLWRRSGRAAATPARRLGTGLADPRHEPQRQHRADSEAEGVGQQPRLAGRSLPLHRPALRRARHRRLRDAPDVPAHDLHARRSRRGAFYDPGRFQRQGAAPEPLRATLFGKGAVQGLDGAAHRQRKSLFVDVLDADAVSRLAGGLRREWEAALPGWERAGSISLYPALSSRC